MLTSEDARARVAARPWFHSIEVGDGLVTPGRVPLEYLQELTRRMRWPERFDGLSVLDIGAWDGFYSFEAERRGAARVVAYDLSPVDYFGFALARELRGSRTEYIQGSVYDLAPEVHGTFDVVLFCGVFYHLRYPLLALDRIWGVTRQYLLMETQVLDQAVVLPDRTQAPLERLGSGLKDLALFQFYRQDELAGDYSNWFAPNRRALEDALWSAGFEPEYLAHWNQRIAFKGTRLPGPPEWQLDSYEGLTWVVDDAGKKTLRRLTRSALPAVPAAPPPAPTRQVARADWSLPPTLSLPELRTRNDSFDQARPDLVASRRHNHVMIDVLHQLQPLAGLAVLDLGCSYRGWALERALELGVSSYLGINLELADPVTVEAAGGVGALRAGNAEELRLPDASFDLVFSLSTFEHFADGGRVLAEIARVLKPGGRALVSFEPVWTAAHGHHLHHLPGGETVPPWSHLLLSPRQMTEVLTRCWPASAALSVEEAVDKIYRDSVINRLSLAAQRQQFVEGPLRVEWMAPLPDEVAGHQELAAYLACLLPFSAEELLTRGLTLWLAQPIPGRDPGLPDLERAPRSANRRGGPAPDCLG
jgi:tRNA (mo5U34)-methyltransferase